eukprot:TRINITY_DN341_c0_g5_i1.p1 TRINITY_DN341_c0_g5~~TRINITY_DN341_c0_g5_i1.p1  ORF type:complete len:318 (-),score=84.20 TRINITY_DN341_c0_g5_i1:126-1079(-)
MEELWNKYPGIIKDHLVEPEFADLEIGRTSYVLHGPEDSDNIILLLHGYSYPGIYEYGEIAADLGEHNFRSLRFDWLGHGHSDSPTDVTYNPELYCQQAEQLIDYLELQDKTFYAIGYSMGGSLLSALVSRNLEKLDFKKIIFCAPAGLTYDYPLLVKLAKSKYIGPWISYFLGKSELRKGNAAGLDPIKHKTLIDHRLSVFDLQYEVNENYLDCMFKLLTDYPFNGGMEKHFENINEYKDIEMLVLWGTKDITVPYHCRNDLEKICPDAKYIDFDGADHAFVISLYEDVIDIFSNFFLGSLDYDKYNNNNNNNEEE